MRPFKDGKGYSKKTTMYSHHCAWCGTQFRGSLDKSYCSDQCRINAWRANKRAGGTLARPIGWLKQRFFVLARDQFKCTYCGRSAADGAVLHVDHIHPKSAGGSDEMENLTTACKECNHGKGDVLLAIRPYVRQDQESP